MDIKAKLSILLVQMFLIYQQFTTNDQIMRSMFCTGVVTLAILSVLSNEKEV